jgi:hypothetical protein
MDDLGSLGCVTPRGGPFRNSGALLALFDRLAADRVSCDEGKNSVL